MVFCLYLDERRGVQYDTSKRSRKFPRAQPKGTLEAISTDTVIGMAITIAISEGKTTAKATAEGKIRAKTIAEDKIIAKVEGKLM